MKFFDKVGTLF